MITLRLPWAGFAPTMFLSTFFGSSASLYGVSEMLLPAYLFSSGLTSNDSRWLTPPQRKIQMTLFAFGRVRGRPDGGMNPASCGDAAFARPSLNNSADNASPVNP